MRTITMNDGTVLPVSMCGASDGVLWLTITESSLSLAEAAALFSDRAKVRVIKHEAEKNDHVTFEGYTQLRHLSVDEDGVSIALKQEVS